MTKKLSLQLEVCLLACLSCSTADCSCGAGSAEPAAAATAPAALEVMEPQPVTDEAPPPEYPKPGFRQVTIEDSVPICVFPGYEEHFNYKLIDEVGKQTLKANTTIVIGAFSPWCVHESCDDRPSLQCSVELEGTTLWVHTKYWGDHKDGSTCTQECRPVTAGCDAGELKAGTYTIQHGKDAYTLKIPSTLRDPCFGR